MTPLEEKLLDEITKGRVDAGASDIDIGKDNLTHSNWLMGIAVALTLATASKFPDMAQQSVRNVALLGMILGLSALLSGGAYQWRLNGLFSCYRQRAALLQKNRVLMLQAAQSPLDYQAIRGLPGLSEADRRKYDALSRTISEGDCYFMLRTDVIVGAQRLLVLSAVLCGVVALSHAKG